MSDIYTAALRAAARVRAADVLHGRRDRARLHVHDAVPTGVVYRLHNAKVLGDPTLKPLIICHPASAGELLTALHLGRTAAAFQELADWLEYLFELQG